VGGPTLLPKVRARLGGWARDLDPQAGTRKVKPIWIVMKQDDGVAVASA